MNEVQKMHITLDCWNWCQGNTCMRCREFCACPNCTECHYSIGSHPCDGIAEEILENGPCILCYKHTKCIDCQICGEEKTCIECEGCAGCEP